MALFIVQFVDIIEVESLSYTMKDAWSGADGDELLEVSSELPMKLPFQTTIGELVGVALTCVTLVSAHKKAGASKETVY